jgi:hypothetical protein
LTFLLEESGKVSSEVFLSNERYSNLCLEAAKNNFSDALRYLREGPEEFSNVESSWTPCPWNEKVFETAARRGNLEHLKYLYLNGCSTSRQAWVLARNAGHEECAEYIDSIL